MKQGTALGTNDGRFIKELSEMQKDGLLDYIELYVLPTVKISEIHRWLTSDLNIAYIHAPHGLRVEYVKEFIPIAEHCYTLLKPKQVRGIVFDAGIAPAQFDIPNSIFYPENMPHKTSLGDSGYMTMPEEMSQFFVFDFAHAYITEQQLGFEPYSLIKKFMDKKPEHYHMTDTKEYKDHLLLGAGELDLKRIKNMIPDDAYVTIETDDFQDSRMLAIRQDLTYFKNL